MSVTPFFFILVILLFGFDSTAAATKNSRKKSKISEMPTFESLRKQ